MKDIHTVPSKKDIYAVPGKKKQHIGKAVSGTVLMLDKRPTGKYICKDQGDGTGIWVLDPVASAEIPIQDALDSVKNINDLVSFLKKAFAKNSTKFSTIRSRPW